MCGLDPFRLSGSRRNAFPAVLWRFDHSKGSYALVLVSRVPGQSVAHLRAIRLGVVNPPNLVRAGDEAL